jgi:hypothetical protein
MNPNHVRADAQRDAAIVALAWLVSAGSLLLGFGSVIAAVAALAVPVAAFMVGGRNAGRGAIFGCLAVAIGSTMVHHVPSAIPATELALLGCLGISSLLGGAAADRLATASSPALAVAPSWMNVVVKYEPVQGANVTAIRPGIVSRYDDERAVRGLSRPSRRDQRRHSQAG